jgi:hypothetical protein
MRITQSDDERLIIVHFTLRYVVMGLLPPLALIGFVIYGVVVLKAGKVTANDWQALLVFTLVGLVWAGLFSLGVRKSTFDFDLLRRELAWTHRGIYRKRTGVLPFDRIKGAMVEVWQGDKMSSVLSYRPILTMTQGTFPLIGYFAGGSSARWKYDSVVATVNKALQTDAASQMDDEILEILAGGQRLAATEMVRKRFGYDLAQANAFVASLIKRSPT